MDNEQHLLHCESTGTFNQLSVGDFIFCLNLTFKL